MKLGFKKKSSHIISKIKIEDNYLENDNINTLVRLYELMTNQFIEIKSLLTEKINNEKMKKDKLDLSIEYITKLHSKYDVLVKEIQSRENELNKYKNGYDMSLKGKMYNRLIGLIDIIDELKLKNDTLDLNIVRDEVINILQYESIEEVIPDTGVPYNTQKNCEVGEVIETDNEQDNLIIDKVAKNAFVYLISDGNEKKFIRPAKVIIKKYVNKECCSDE